MSTKHEDQQNLEGKGSSRLGADAESLVADGHVRSKDMSGPRVFGVAQSSKRVIIDFVKLADLVGIALAALLAQWIYISTYLGGEQDEAVYLTVGVLGAVVAVTMIGRQGIYSIDTLIRLRRQTGRLLLGLSVAFVTLLTVGYLLKVSAQFSRGWMTVWFVLSLLVLFANHALAARVLQRWKSYGLFARNVAVYGSGEIAQKLIEHLSGRPDDMRVQGVFDDLQPGTIPNVVVSGGLSDLIRVGQTVHFDEIVIAVPLSERTRITNLVTQLSILPTNIRLCPDLIGFNLRPIGVVSYDGLSVLELVPAPMDNWAPILKSIEDRVLASIALVLVLPVMVLTAAAIKLDSRGPVFFHQRRHGFNHQVISVAKFRSMNVTQDGDHVPQAQREDPRVTRVGKFLRRTSLDELPQLFNVIKGEMSLVGPRPHAIAHNAYYSAVLETYASRHKVKPGITGWAQINGCRGETDTPDKMRRRIEYDLYYIENWSVWFDIKILMLTPFFGLFGKNAF
jgi:Undecaprenyl-phosphate glucose phosphotransferase